MAGRIASLPKGEEMKTLDEVIRAFEYTYENDPIAWTYGVDALYHLKEYKRYQNTPSRHGHMTLVDWFEESQKNEPLTWDELKTMEGKPVWIEWVSGTWKGLRKWVISHGCDDLMMVFTALDVAGVSYDGHLRQMNLGKTWQAYRKERDEVAE